MIKLKVKNQKKFTRAINKWIDEATKEAADVARGLAVVGFNQVLEQSAQRSGNFAGNWQFSINQVNYDFKDLGLLSKDADELDWYIMGDLPAINYAISNNKGRDKGYVLGDTFYISNSAHEGADNYAIRIEKGEIEFRPGNMGMPAASAALYLSAYYGRIGKAEAATLKKERI